MGDRYQAQDLQERGSALQATKPQQAFSPPKGPHPVKLLNNTVVSDLHNQLNTRNGVPISMQNVKNINYQPDQTYSGSQQKPIKIGKDQNSSHRIQQMMPLNLNNTNDRQSPTTDAKHIAKPQLTKSYNFDAQAMTQRLKNQQTKLLDNEERTSNGYIIALACGPLKKQRYINPKIEVELSDFKTEIEQKFAKSELQTFVMPRLRTQKKSTDLRIESNEPQFNIQAIRHHQLRQQLAAQSTDASTLNSYLQSVQFQTGQIKGIAQGNSSALSRALNQQEQIQQALNQTKRHNAPGAGAPRGNSKLDPMFLPQMQKSLHLEDIKNMEINKMPASSTRAGAKLPTKINPQNNGESNAGNNGLIQQQQRNRYQQAVDIYSQPNAGTVPLRAVIGQVRLDPIEVAEQQRAQQVVSLKTPTEQMENRSKTKVSRNLNLIASQPISFQQQAAVLTPLISEPQESTRMHKGSGKQNQPRQAKLVMQSYNGQLPQGIMGQTQNQQNFFGNA